MAETNVNKCEYCGPKFQHDSSTNSNRFCSREYQYRYDKKHSKCKSSAFDMNARCCQRCGKDMSACTDDLIIYDTENGCCVNDVSNKSDKNLMILCKGCYNKFLNEIHAMTDRFRGQYHFEKAADEILLGLKEMGFELDYANFHNTPKRFARAYQEIFEGCVNTQEQIDEILATKFPANGNNSMIVANDIIVFSMCPHHLLPVEYHVCVGYIPNKNGEVLGISKLARLVSVLSKRPALQETFTQDIVNCLNDIGVYGAIALVEGQHMCMRMRGAKATNSTITTTAVSGIFADDASAKTEFLNSIQSRKKFNN